MEEGRWPTMRSVPLAKLEITLLLRRSGPIFSKELLAIVSRLATESLNFNLISRTERGKLFVLNTINLNLMYSEISPALYSLLFSFCYEAGKSFLQQRYSPSFVCSTIVK